MFSATERFAVICHELGGELGSLQRQDADVRVEGGQRRPGRRALPGPLVVQADDGGVRVQRDLQVQDVVDDVLQDLHPAHLPVLRDAGHQLLELGVAVVHVVQPPQMGLDLIPFILVQAGPHTPPEGQYPDSAPDRSSFSKPTVGGRRPQERRW